MTKAVIAEHPLNVTKAVIVVVDFYSSKIKRHKLLHSLFFHSELHDFLLDVSFSAQNGGNVRISSE